MSDHLSQLAAVHLRQQPVLQPRLASRFESALLGEPAAVIPTGLFSDVPATEDDMTETPAQSRLDAPAQEPRAAVSEFPMPQTTDTSSDPAAELPPLMMSVDQPPEATPVPAPATEIPGEPLAQPVEPESRPWELELNPATSTQPFARPDQPSQPSAASQVPDSPGQASQQTPEVREILPVAHATVNRTNTVQPIVPATQPEPLMERSEPEPQRQAEVQPLQWQQPDPGQQLAQTANYQPSGIPAAPSAGEPALVPSGLMTTPPSPVDASPSIAAPALVTLESHRIEPVMTELFVPEQAEPVRPTVHVTIGRIEVRAVTPPPPPQPATPATPRPRYRPKLSLQDYLAQRDGGRS